VFSWTGNVDYQSASLLLLLKSASEIKDSQGIQYLVSVTGNIQNPVEDKVTIPRLLLTDVITITTNTKAGNKFKFYKLLHLQ